MKKTLVAVQPHNEKAAATWSSPGGRYDVISQGINGAIDHGIERLDVRPGERVLDLATGTGNASRRLASVQPAARITGVDIAHGLVESAKELAAKEKLAIEYEVGDAEDLPYDDGSFDAVISSFGIMFTSRPEAAARELTRVTRKGGRFSLIVWEPDSTLFEMFQVMKPYMPAPPTPAPPSPFLWGSVDRAKELLGADHQLGFETGVSNFYAKSGQDAWEIWVNHYGPTQTLAAHLDDTRREQFKNDMVKFHERFRTDLGVLMPRAYRVIVGTRK
jgi:SAM-dependent methyltransferase